MSPKIMKILLCSNNQPIFLLISGTQSSGSKPEILVITKREMLKIGKISKHGTAAVYCQGGNFYNCINF